MTTQLRWHVGLSSACYYAAARNSATLAEPDFIETPFSKEVAALTAFLAAEQIEPVSFFAQLAALAPTIDARGTLTHTALTKLAGRARADALAPPGASANLVGLLGACEREYQRAYPQILEELRLRMGPLRELWEARGPGLLAGVGRRTDRSLIVEAATIALVSPLAGGGGAAFPATNVVRFEAVLANPIAELPESVRLAWLVSQLATDQLEPVEPIRSGPPLELVGAAMLPALLEAAADLEMVAGDDPALLTRAAEAWGSALLAKPGVVDVVRDWWATARRSDKNASLPWNVRLAALDRMLAGDFGDQKN